MARHVVLVVSSRPARLDVRQEVVHAAGHWPLPAPTIVRALALAAKVRPSLVLVDADLSDGRAGALIEALRGIPALTGVRVIVLGELNPAEHDVVARDPHVRVHPVPDGAGLHGLLAATLGVRDATPGAKAAR